MGSILGPGRAEAPKIRAGRQPRAWTTIALPQHLHPAFGESHWSGFTYDRYSRNRPLDANDLA